MPHSAANLPSSQVIFRTIRLRRSTGAVASVLSTTGAQKIDSAYRPVGDTIPARFSTFPPEGEPLAVLTPLPECRHSRRAGSPKVGPIQSGFFKWTYYQSAALQNSLLSGRKI